MMPVNKEPCPFYEAASPRDALASAAPEPAPATEEVHAEATSCNAETAPKPGAVAQEVAADPELLDYK